MPSWVVGSSPDCEIVVDQPTVSGHHCRLTRSAAGYQVEDLGSTNGTFVNGVRIAAPTAVTRSDAVMLGALTALPWDRVGNGGAERVIRIGREPDNDVVLDYPAVSGHHARVIVVGGLATIEDLGSTNGTSVGVPGRAVARAALAGSDTVYFGSFAVPASRLLAATAPRPAAPPSSIRFQEEDQLLGRDPECDIVVDLPSVSGRHARLSRSGGRVVIEDLDSSNGTHVNGRRIQGREAVSDGDVIGLGDWTASLIVEAPAPVVIAAADGARSPAGNNRLAPSMALLAQAPVIAGLIVLAFRARVGGRLDAASWDRVAGGVEGTTFVLGLAAFWLGASASLGNLSLYSGDRREGVGDLGPKLGVLAASAIVPSLVLLVIVHAGLGLRGPWMAMLVVMALASAVGLAMGLVAMAATRSVAPAAASLAAIFATMTAIAGAPVLAGGDSPAVGLAAKATPARWAFEGLLLAESDTRPTLAPSSAGAGPRDMAERAFPLADRRMGFGACVLALSSMLVGLLGWAGVLFIPAGAGRRAD